MTVSIMNLINPDGEVIPYKEYKNSWLFAMVVWNHLCEKYVPKLPNEVDELWHYRVFFKNNGQLIWDLWSNKNLSQDERLTLGMTLDGMIVRKEEFASFAKSIRSVRQEMKTRVSHLDAIAKDLDTLLWEMKDCIGVCWWQNSMSDNYWVRQDKDGVEYNINIKKDGKKHHFLYDEIKEVEEEMAAAK